MTDFLKLLSDECPGFKWTAFTIDYKDGKLQDLAFCEDTLGRNRVRPGCTLPWPQPRDEEEDEDVGQALAAALNKHKNDLLPQVIEKIPDLPKLKPKDRLYGVVFFVKRGPSEDEDINCSEIYDSENVERSFHIPESFSGIMVEATHKAHVENQVEIP